MKEASKNVQHDMTKMLLKVSTVSVYMELLNFFVKISDQLFDEVTNLTETIPDLILMFFLLEVGLEVE